MNTYLMVIGGLLIATLMVGLVRVIKGPSTADRMLASQLFGTAGVAVLMLLAVVKQESALLNAALVLALLAPLSLITFVRLGGKKS